MGKIREVWKLYYQKYIDKEVYKRVLSVARSYYQDLNKIKQIETDYIFMSSQSHGAGGNNISDPTYSIVNQIEKHTKVLRSRTTAVEKALSKFNPKERDLIMQNLINNNPILYCNTLVSEVTAKRLRQRFIICLASELGEVVWVDKW